MPGLDWRKIQPIISNPSTNLKGFAILLQRLREAGVLVGHDELDTYGPSALVKLDKEFSGRLALFPNKILRPVVRYQQELNYFSILHHSQLSYRVMVVGNGVATQDYTRLLELYPTSWIKTWALRDGLYQLPTAISQLIDHSSKKTLKGRAIRIPQMSAVAPNVSLPKPPDLLSLSSTNNVPQSPSHWYTLSIMPRHKTNIFMPRVNNNSPIAYINSSSSSHLIDANFSTIALAEDSKLTELSTFALFNSTWVQALLEFIATPMGGGALKVEAAHLKKVPLPILEQKTIGLLEELGADLLKEKVGQESSPILLQINQAVCKAIAERTPVSSNELFQRLEKTIKDMQGRRTR